MAIDMSLTDFDTSVAAKMLVARGQPVKGSVMVVFVFDNANYTYTPQDLVCQKRVAWARHANPGDIRQRAS